MKENLLNSSAKRGTKNLRGQQGVNNRFTTVAVQLAMNRYGKSGNFTHTDLSHSISLRLHNALAPDTRKGSPRKTIASCILSSTSMWFNVGICDLTGTGNCRWTSELYIFPREAKTKIQSIINISNIAIESVLGIIICDSERSVSPRLISLTGDPTIVPLQKPRAVTFS